MTDMSWVSPSVLKSPSPWEPMWVALRSRGYRPRSLRGASALAEASGTLFVRSYERGERVHLAMLSRGYTGTMPDIDEPQPVRRQWLMAALVVLAAGTITALGWITR